MAWLQIASNALKLATYWLNPKERCRRRKRDYIKKINNLRTKQLKARRIGDENLWNQLDKRIRQMNEEVRRLND